MRLFERLVLKDSIEIEATPEEIWDFFANLERNYKAWHPEDHVSFKWIKGRPMESGSTWYAEEILGGGSRRLKGKGTIGEVIANRKIVFKFPFPMSIVSPGFEWHIEPKGTGSVFTAVSYVRCCEFFRLIARSHVDANIEAGKKHVREEGENLKKLLEEKGS